MPALVGALLVGELTGVLAGGAAMLGHWRPLFLRFQKGGKTVATGGGVFLGAAPLAGLDRGRGLDRRLSSSPATRRSPRSWPRSRCRSWRLVLGEPWPIIVFGAIAAVGVVLLHRPNIARLRAGTESRFRLRRA